MWLVSTLCEVLLLGKLSSSDGGGEGRGEGGGRGGGGGGGEGGGGGRVITHLKIHAVAVYLTVQFKAEA